MFMVSEDDAEAVLTAMLEGGEPAAIAELRRRFAGIADDTTAALCVRSIATWQQPRGAPSRS